MEKDLEYYLEAAKIKNDPLTQVINTYTDKRNNKKLDPSKNTTDKLKSLSELINQYESLVDDLLTIVTNENSLMHSSEIIKMQNLSNELYSQKKKLLD